VLCLAPSAELVIQNSEKYGATGNKFSIFSASAGSKSLKHPVVFGTPLTVANRIKKFGSQFAMVIIDEAHGLTPTIRNIVDAMREQNQLLRVVGMTATPYRMNTGYIFGRWPDGSPVAEHEAINPYFSACVDRITAKELIDHGYLTVPKLGNIHAESYHTLDMQLNSRGQFDTADVDRAYIGQGRKTAAIISDVVYQAKERQGVMIFAATVQHAYECLDSLPRGLSAIVTGDTPRQERADIIARFKAREIKYIVNVSVLTTGFDAPHVDLIAMLRATESVGLLQQIIGRGLRTAEGKDDCLILDYAENIERHCPDGDIFNPTIKTVRSKDNPITLKVRCQICETTNEFRARPNPSGFEITDSGYFADLDGNTIETEHGPMPAHYGRRCQSKALVAGQLVQCGSRWTSKLCPHCEADNDIAARYCEACRGEIIDPNEKLVAEFKAMKADPTRQQTDIVTGWNIAHSKSKSGRSVYRVKVTTPYRSFTFWVQKYPTWTHGYNERNMLAQLGGKPPETITYRKDGQWFKVVAYNRKADEIPE
jgi:DNA repair protein RadD